MAGVEGVQGTQLLQGRQSSECRGTRQRHGLQTLGTGVPGSGAAKGGQCRSEGRLADGSGCGCSGGSSVRFSERGAVAQAVARSAHPSRLLLPRRELGPRTRAVRSPRRTGRDKRGASVGRREDHAVGPSHAESGRVDAKAGQAHPRAAVPQQRDALHLAPLVALRRGAWPDLVHAMAPLGRWRWWRHTLAILELAREVSCWVTPSRVLQQLRCRWGPQGLGMHRCLCPCESTLGIHPSPVWDTPTAGLNMAVKPAQPRAKQGRGGSARTPEYFLVPRR